MDLSKFKLELDTSVKTLKSFKIENLDVTPMQEFKNPSEDNTQSLKPVHNELWLQIFSYLDADALVAAMISCKFFAEITNEQAIRNSLGQRIKLMHFNRSINRASQNLFFYDLNSQCESNTRLFNKIPLIPRYKLDIVLEGENEFHQPGDNGFVMKK